MNLFLSKIKKFFQNIFLLPRFRERISTLEEKVLKLEKEISENSLITETVLIDDSDFVFIHDDDDLLETENSSEIEPGSFKKNWLN